MIEASAVDWKSSVDALRRQTEQQDNPHCRLVLNQRAAQWSARFASGDSHDIMVALLAAAQADAVAAECVRCSAELQLVAAETLARVGEAAHARELLGSWDARWPDTNARAKFARLRAGAALSVCEGADEAPTLLREVIAAANEASTRLEELWGLIDLGAVLVGRDTAAAAEAWSIASRLATELGAVSEHALVGQRLREIGVRRIGRTRRPTAVGTPVAGLSRRELKIACLAVRGARNVDIARTLFISPKTVEQHISRVFAKLGVHNRAELGSRYAEQLHAEADPEK
jgi:DNA-binding CsgD family transcriptional regulator